MFTSRARGHHVDASRSGPRSPRGSASHAVYSTTRASARTAASTAGYDGTEPRPAVDPATSGHPQQLGDALAGQEGRDQRLVGLLADRREHVGHRLPRGVQRRDEDRHDRVDLGVVDGGVERLLEVLGGGLRAQRDRLLGLQADRHRGVGGEQPERVGVADHRHPADRVAAAGARRAGRRRTSRRACRPGSRRPAGTSRRRPPAGRASSAPRGPSARPASSGPTSPRSRACAARPAARAG